MSRCQMALFLFLIKSCSVASCIALIAWWAVSGIGLPVNMLVCVDVCDGKRKLGENSFHVERYQRLTKMMSSNLDKVLICAYMLPIFLLPPHCPLTLHEKDGFQCLSVSGWPQGSITHAAVYLDDQWPRPGTQIAGNIVAAQVWACQYHNLEQI